MTTFIESAHVKTIVALSGQAIRRFLADAPAEQFTGTAYKAIAAFRSSPQDFSDEKLVAYGTDIERAIAHAVRIEVRAITKDGHAAEVVAKGIWGEGRRQTREELVRICQQQGLDVELKLAGTSSIEFNRKDVNKALVIRFMTDYFEDVLQQMNYQPGPVIDSRKSRTVIASDADGTIYSRPQVGIVPMLASSPVFEPLVAYLRAGGIFLLISGNDLNRTARRVVQDLPKEVYSRLLISANGGAELVSVDSQGQLVAIQGYQEKALPAKTEQAKRLDIVYIGDDGDISGNDYLGFKAVGFERSVLVAPKFLTTYDPGLQKAHVGGGLEGTQKFLKDFLAKRMADDWDEDSYGAGCCGGH